MQDKKELWPDSISSYYKEHNQSYSAAQIEENQDYNLDVLPDVEHGFQQSFRSQIYD